MVVGKQDPKQAATTEPMPFTARDGRVGYESPAASADSMFCSEPRTLNSPIGTTTGTRY